MDLAVRSIPLFWGDRDFESSGRIPFKRRKANSHSESLRIKSCEFLKDRADCSEIQSETYAPFQDVESRTLVWQYLHHPDQFYKHGAQFANSGLSTKFLVGAAGLLALHTVKKGKKEAC